MLRLLSKHWFALACGFVGIADIAALIVWRNHSDLSSWIQAIGTIEGLALAVAVPAADRHHARREDRESDWYRVRYHLSDVVSKLQTLQTNLGRAEFSLSAYMGIGQALPMFSPRGLIGNCELPENLKEIVGELEPKSGKALDLFCISVAEMAEVAFIAENMIEAAANDHPIDPTKSAEAANFVAENLAEAISKASNHCARARSILLAE